jgi:hypothetical protein
MPENEPLSNLGEWDSAKLKLEAPHGTPSPLREAYAAVAETIFHAWQARYQPIHNRFAFRDAIADPLANALRGASALITREDVWLQTRAGDALQAFLRALEEANRIHAACGHIVLKLTETEPVAYLSRQPHFDAYTIMNRIREATCRAAFRIGPNAAAAQNRIQAPAPAAPVGPEDGSRVIVRTAGINARMMETIHADPEAMGWNSTQWAKHLKCAKSSVVATQTWKDLSMRRERERAERAQDRRRRPRTSDRKRD